MSGVFSLFLVQPTKKRMTDGQSAIHNFLQNFGAMPGGMERLLLEADYVTLADRAVC
jgi:hypothetical protein